VIWLKAFIVWLLMVLVESIHGSLREFIITPLIGDSLARQLSFFSGIF